METETKPQAEKKEWKAPELIVLVRSNPDEAVLAACKDPAGDITGPQLGNDLCLNHVPPCAVCSANAIS